MRPDLLKYLQYVENTGGNVDIAGFDDDWEPIGPMIRREIMPIYVIEKDGKLILTEPGRALVSAGGK